MKENRERAINSVITMEGGFAERENEPGGACNMGVSLQVFREEYPGATVEELKNMTREQAVFIYGRRFANPIGFDEQPSGYDLALLHCAVMFGVSGAVNVFDFQAKGDLGLLCLLMMFNKMHRKIEDWHFMAGWANRIKAVYEMAKPLTEGQV
ncbi:MAG TPA: glycosyl hydrolase 108 family protein [Candidatus Paceibacterota bacterium]